MAHTHRRLSAHRPGLTLMELVVVLAILAALAAIVIPLFPNLLRRAHKASDATQTNEMAKQVQLFQALYTGYPDGFDLLTDGTTGFPDYLPAATAGKPFGNFVTVGTLAQTEIDALNAVGIKTAAPMEPTRATPTDATLFHPTMYPYTSTASPVPITTATKVAILNDAGVVAGNPRFLAELRKDPAAKFIVFGVGPKCAMVGRNIQDAPTSVPQKSDFTPDNTYSRVGIIFQYAGKAVDAGDGRALFVTACALEDDELESTEKDIIGYYQAARDPRLP